MKKQDLIIGSPIVITNKIISPTMAGWYFVKNKSANYWQVLIRINGKLPLMHVSYQKPLFKTDDDKILQDKDNLVWSERVLLTDDDVKEYNELTAGEQNDN